MFLRDFLEAIQQYILGLKPKHGEKYDVLWQTIVCSWQFKDLEKSIAYYVRFKDKSYIPEIKTHLADLMIQVVAMCLVLDIDPNEILALGFQRLKEHAKIEIYPKFWECEN